MSNLIANGSFESAGDWTFTGYGLRGANSNAYAGDYICSLTYGREVLSIDPETGEITYGPWTDSAAIQSVTVLPGATYRLRVHAYKESGATGLLLRVRHGSGELETVYTFDPDEWSATWGEAGASVTAEDTTLEVRFITSGDEVNSGTWYIDYVEVLEMAFTRALRDALVTDLQQITTGNGYTFTLGEVLTEPKPLREVIAPAVAIAPGPGGASEVEELTNQTGYATQQFVLQLVTRGTETAAQDMDNLLDDVRNAIERTAGTLMTTSGVEMVAVTGWTEVITNEAVHQGTYYREATVEVRYLYTRGNA